MLKIRRSHDRLIFNMGIPIPEKIVFILRGGPDIQEWKYSKKFFSVEFELCSKYHHWGYCPGHFDSFEDQASIDEIYGVMCDLITWKMIVHCPAELLFIPSTKTNSLVPCWNTGNNISVLNSDMSHENTMMSEVIKTLPDNESKENNFYIASCNISIW